MSDIRKSLLQLIFSGSFMKRWNDKLRPMELIELDKQAHKMIAAWALVEINSRRMSLKEQLDLRVAVIEGGLFEYFYRLVITDIKPPIFYQIKADPEHYRRLTEWVLEELKPRILPLGDDFFQRLTNYLAKPEQSSLAGRILQAAHLYASSWEFNLLKGVNPISLDEELQEIDAMFHAGLSGHRDIEGVTELMAGAQSPLGRFLHLCGQLRFQKRWSQTPRIPETSVIGHMFIVACYAYFFSLVLDASSARRANDFFSGLFHDLPELLTRDIISPVKKSVQDLGDLIKGYENRELDRRVLTPLREGGFEDLAGRLEYFLGLEVGSEFQDLVRRDGRVEKVKLCVQNSPDDRDELDPKDGEMLKVCDTLAAFIEAYTTMRNGIQNDQLQQALWRIREGNRQLSLADRIHVGALLADFD